MIFMEAGKRSPPEKLVVLAAEGFGAGRAPFAPGTFGTLAGFIWIYLLLLPQNIWIYLTGIIAGFSVAVWIGGRAEHIMGVTDPGSIVIDEIAALPLAFLPAVFWTMNGIAVRGFEKYFTAREIALPLLCFILFRIFDIAKPLGIRRIQSLPGGWGLVMDDFLAAAAAAIPLLVALKLFY